MNNKNTRVALAAALALGAGTACAQASSVTLFGLIDTNVSHLRSSGNGNLNIVGSDGNLSSRIGFRGTEDLGGGLHAGFNLEMWLNPDSGQVDNGGRGFGRWLSWFILAGEIYTAFAFLGASGWAYARGGPTFYILGYGGLAYMASYWILPAVSVIGKK